MPYIGQEPVAGNFVLLDAITTSATATYALTKNSVAYSPESSRNMIVSLNGVTQAPETAYTVSGSNITFSSALTASDVIDYILVLGDVLDIGRPSDGVVGTDQMNYPLGNFSSTGIDDNATSTAITIDSSENVGIGTTSPSTALHIDTGTTNDAIRLVSTDADVNILMGDNTGSVRLQNSGGDFVAYTGTSAFGGFAETMRIDSSGHAIIPAGITLGTAAGTYNAANTLDDYEEGTWTGIVADAASGGNESASACYGYYTKVGNIVYVHFNVSNINTTGLTAGNDVYITGLPFTSNSVTGNAKYTGTAHMSVVTFDQTPIINMDENQTAIRIAEVRSAAGIDFVVVSQLSSGVSDIHGNLVYQTA